jgi:peptidoglycan/LPS O-acetylase OafA/YrhL
MRYNPALDGIRALAVMSVLVFHVAQHLPIPVGSAALRGFRIASMGWSGVDLFFVLSGYLITSILLASRNGSFGQYCRTFYARRALRIFPLYFVVVPAVLLLLQVFGTPRPAWYDWLTQLTYTQNTIGLYYPSQVGGYLGHTWSLAIEEWFYLVWPFFVFFLSPRALRRAALLGILAILVLRLAAVQSGAHLPTYASSVMRFDTLLVGALIAISPLSQLGRRIWIVAGSLAFGISVLARLASQNLTWVALFNSGVGYTLVAFGAAALVVACIDQHSGISRIFSWTPLSRIGRISYGIYLFHLPILAIFAKYTMPLTAHFDYSARFLTLLLPVALLTLGVAWLSFNHFEKRMLVLKSRFEYRDFQTESVPAPAAMAP